MSYLNQESCRELTSNDEQNQVQHLQYESTHRLTNNLEKRQDGVLVIDGESDSSADDETIQQDISILHKVGPKEKKNSQRSKQQHQNSSKKEDGLETRRNNYVGGNEILLSQVHLTESQIEEQKQIDNTLYQIDNCAKNSGSAKSHLKQTIDSIFESTLSPESFLDGTKSKINVNDDQTSEINQNQDSNTDTTTTINQQKSKKAKLILIFGSIGIIIVLALIIGLLVWHYTHDSSGTKDNSIVLGNQIVVAESTTQDAISGQIIPKYPSNADTITKLFTSLKQAPIKYDTGEEAVYNGTMSYSLSSDAFASLPQNGKTMTLQYNITFYTLNRTKDYMTVVTYFKQIEKSSKGQQTQQFDEDGPPLTDEQEQEALNFLEKTLKICVSRVSYNGSIIQTGFLKYMEYDDQKLCLDFLKMYIPDMDIKNFKISKPNKRFLQAGNDQSLQDEFNQLSLTSKSSTSSQNDVFSQSQTSDSDHDLDLNTGKLALITQSLTMNLVFDFDETAEGIVKPPVKRVSSERKLKITRISSQMISQENNTEIYMEPFSYDIIIDPISNLSNTNPLQVNTSDNLFEDNLSNENRRNLQVLYEQINIELANLKLLTFNLGANYQLQSFSESMTQARVKINLLPSASFNQIQTNIIHNMKKAVREIRYYQALLHRMLTIQLEIGQALANSLDGFQQNMIVPVNNSFMPFLPIFKSVEDQLSNYTEIIVNGSVNIENSLSIGKMIQEVINDHYVNQFQGILDHWKQEIDSIKFRYTGIIVESIQEVNASSLANSKETFTALNTSRGSFLQKFDQILSTYNQSEIQLIEKVSSSINHTQSVIRNLEQNPQMSAFSDQKTIKMLLDSVVLNTMNSFGLFKNMLEGLQEITKMKVLIHHAKARDTIEKQFDENLEVIKKNLGSKVLNNTHYQILDQMITKASQLQPNDFFSEDQQRDVVVELESSYTDLSSIIVQDILGSAGVAGEMVRITENFFMQLHKQMITNLTQVNITIPQNFNSRFQDSKFQFNATYYNSFMQLHSIKTLFQQELNKAPNVNVSITEQLSDLKQLSTQVDTLYKELQNYTEKNEESKKIIEQFELNMEKIANAPQRIQSKFNSTIQRLTQVRNQLNLTFQIPNYDFSLSQFKFKASVDKALEDLRKESSNQGKQRVAQLAQSFSTPFITDLENMCNAKIRPLVPNNYTVPLQKHQQKLYSVQLPVAQGSHLIQVTYFQDSSMSINYQLKDGQLVQNIDTQVLLSYRMETDWGLSVAKYHVDIYQGIAKVDIYASNGMSINSATPFMSQKVFGVFRNLYEDYQMLESRYYYEVRRVCWRKRTWYGSRYTYCENQGFHMWTPYKVIESNTKQTASAFNQTFVDKKWSVSYF